MKTALLVAIAFSTIFAGLALDDDSSNSIFDSSVDSRFIYRIDQNVSGVGYFSAYKNTNVANLELSSPAHGSGKYDSESLTFAADGAKYDRETGMATSVEYDASGNLEYDMWGNLKPVDDRRIILDEKSNFSYSPMNMQLVKYFQPGDMSMSFRSKGMGKTNLKNYDSGVSINAKFNYASDLQRNLSAELFWKVTENDDDTEKFVDRFSNTKLNLEAAFTGKGQIGVMERIKGIKGANILIDEDYSGTYSIIKNISHSSITKTTLRVDSWLPCCYGGFSDVVPVERAPFKSAKGIFDCTCTMSPSES